MASSVLHFTHPHHLIMKLKNSCYTCDLCQKIGTGIRYRCSACDFDLHEHCVAYPASITSPLHPMHNLFCRELNPTMAYYCDSCKQRAKGYAYSCRHCNFDLHPDCSGLLQLKPQPSLSNELERNLGGLTLDAGNGNRYSRAAHMPGLAVPTCNSGSSLGNAYSAVSNNYSFGQGVPASVNNFSVLGSINSCLGVGCGGNGSVPVGNRWGGWVAAVAGRLGREAASNIGHTMAEELFGSDNSTSDGGSFDF